MFFPNLLPEAIFGVKVPTYAQKCDFGPILDPEGVPKSTLGATFSPQKSKKGKCPELRGASWSRPGRDGFL